MASKVRHWTIVGRARCLSRQGALSSVSLAMGCLGGALLLGAVGRPPLGFVQPLQGERLPRRTVGASLDRQPVPAATPSISSLAPVVAAMLGACALSLGRASKRRPSQVPRGAIGSVETKKFLGDWASLAPSAGDTQDEAAAARELIKTDLTSCISQIRGIYPAGTERYGEEFSRNEGSTDNAYLVTPDSDKPLVLVGVHDERFAEEFVAVIGEESLGKLGAVVLQYFDGKQSGTIEALIRARPVSSAPLSIHCSNPIAVALRKKLPEDLSQRFSIEVIKNKSTLEIEEGRTMRFVLTPTPKTPEACIAFDPATGTLFTGKFFSAHREITKNCSGYDEAGIQGWENYSSDWYHLFDCFFFTQNAQTAIRRLFMLAEALHGPDVQQLAPLHGPVVREQCWKLMAKYEAWTEQKLRLEDRRDTEVLVMYASAYGHTKTLANAIADGLKSASVNVNMLDLEHVTAKEVLNALEKCNGFFLGSPTLGGEMPTQVKEALGVVLSSASSEDTEKVPCGVFGSYGWSGEAVDEMLFRLKDGGFPLVCDPIRVRFRPTEQQLELCKEAGVRMSQKLQSLLKETKRRRIRDINPSFANSAAEAFGKMRCSKCVLATQDKTGKDIVTPISWVNQASFDPPGITLAVPKKDLDPFLSLSTDEQLEILFRRYDADGGGSLDREELTQMLKELFGVHNAEAAKLMEGKIDEALQILDENNDGSVDLDEIREASLSGPLATLLENRRKLLALEEAIGSAPQGIEKDASGGLQFVLNFLPQGTDSAVLEAPERHPKAKPKNGCFVLKDSNAFIECAVTQALDVGDHTMLYARVLNGKVLKGNDLTELVTMIEKKEKESAPAVAMASAGRAAAQGQWSSSGAAGAAAGPTGLRSTFAAGAGRARPHHFAHGLLGPLGVLR